MEYLFDKQVIVRLFNPDVDLSHLISFYIDPKTSPEQATQLAEMAWPGHNPAQDRWIAELTYSPNHIIGYAYTFMRPLKKLLFR
jgi:hypothetical protein